MRCTCATCAALARLSHYDQVIEAARKGSGVAIGKWPHLSDDLREGTLVAPLGPNGEAIVGGFFVEVADTADADAATPFLQWVRAEAAASAGWREAGQTMTRARRTRPLAASGSRR